MGVVRVPKPLRLHDPSALAPLVGLTVVGDDRPGVTRVKWGRGFRYVDPDGRTITVPARQRYVDLAVPPAWQGVWMCPVDTGYLQATGRDAADRKQYRYHDDYRRVRDLQKFERLRYFGRALERLRQAAEEGLAREPGSRTHAVSAVLRLIDVGLVRVGNDESAAQGRHGASTLHADHLEFESDLGYVTLTYTAKSGKERTVVVEDDEFVEVLHDLADTDAERLFWYLDDDGSEVRVRADLVNRMIAEIVGPAFTTKDFRTWGGSRAALEARLDGADSVEAVDAAAEVLGNTRAVARASYVHPVVLDADIDVLEEGWRRSRTTEWMSRSDRALAKILRSSPPLFDLAG